MATELYDDAGHSYVPEASDRDTRYALRWAMDALEDHANGADREAILAAEEFFQMASPGVMSDLGVV